MFPALIFAASLSSASIAQTLNWTTVDNVCLASLVVYKIDISWILGI